MITIKAYALAFWGALDHPANWLATITERWPKPALLALVALIAVLAVL